MYLKMIQPISLFNFADDSACFFLLLLPLDAGAQAYPNATFGWVNVKDVANAHIQAFEVPSASGRYCLVERVLHYSEIVNVLRELYPAFQLPVK